MGKVVGNYRPTRKIILNDIISYISKHGYSPSFQEICESTGIKSTSTIFYHISEMLKDGVLETDHGIGTPRAIRVPGYRFVKDEGDKNG